MVLSLWSNVRRWELTDWASSLLAYTRILHPTRTQNSENIVPALMFNSHFNILLFTETPWAELCFTACQLLMCNKEKRGEKSREMTDNLAGLSTVTQFPLWIPSWPSLLPSDSQHFCVPQVVLWQPESGHLTKKVQSKNLEREQKWSNSLFPTLFLAAVYPRRRERTLPKQRDGL